MPSQFGDNDCTGGPSLVMGAARGRRTFYLDPHGILRGVTFKMPWRDGENLAQCLAARCVGMTEYARHVSKYASDRPQYEAGGVSFNGDPDDEPMPMPGFEWEPCDGLAHDCGCGFYAYHDGTQAYGIGGPGPGIRVTAIIEGYGKVILGKHGYRAEKARILAVLIPDGDTTAQAAEVRRAMNRELQDAYEDRDALVKTKIAGPVIPFALTAALSLTYMSPIGYLAAGALGVLALVTQRYWMSLKDGMVEAKNRELYDLERKARQLPIDWSGHLEKVRVNYPSVEFFTDPMEMRAKYPVENLTALLGPDADEGKGTE